MICIICMNIDKYVCMYQWVDKVIHQETGDDFER